MSLPDTYTFVYVQRMNVIESENVKAGWARPDGVLRYAPFGRTTLYDLINRGLIESYVIGKPGVKRCVRLINLASLDSYIRDPQAAEVRAANGREQPAATKTGGGHYARPPQFYEKQQQGKEQQKHHPTLGSL